MNPMDWKKRIAVYFGFTAFTFMGILMLTTDDFSSRYPSWLMYPCAVFGIIFFGGGGLIFAYQDIRSNLLHMNHVDFSDSGLSIYGDMIAWSKIKGFDLYKNSGADIILVMTKHPEQDIEEEESWLKRKAMLFSLKTSGAVYSFSTMLMKGSPEEILLYCEEKLREHKSSIKG
jgi:hypothetical protein